LEAKEELRETDEVDLATMDECARGSWWDLVQTLCMILCYWTCHHHNKDHLFLILPTRYSPSPKSSSSQQIMDSGLLKVMLGKCKDVGDPEGNNETGVAATVQLLSVKHAAKRAHIELWVQMIEVSVSVSFNPMQLQLTVNVISCRKLARR